MIEYKWFKFESEEPIEVMYPNGEIYVGLASEFDLKDVRGIRKIKMHTHPMEEPEGVSDDSYLVVLFNGGLFAVGKKDNFEWGYLGAFSTIKSYGVLSNKITGWKGLRRINKTGE